MLTNAVDGAILLFVAAVHKPKTTSFNKMLKKIKKLLTKFAQHDMMSKLPLNKSNNKANKFADEP